MMPALPKRVDHVQLLYTYLGFPSNLTKAESGWLVLTERNEIQFFKQKNLNLDVQPTFTSPSIQAADAKLGSVYFKMRFGTQRRYVYFTGFLRPAGSSADAAGVVGGVGLLAGNPVLGNVGGVASVVGQGAEFLNNRGFRQRRNEAKQAWTIALAPVPSDKGR
jgi:hypothetical protein